MATLTSRLIISLQDQVSGPAAAVRRQLEMLRRDMARPFVGGAFNLGRQMEAEAKRVQAAAQRVATSLSPAAFGMGALIHATQDYEKAFYGVKASMIADNMDEMIENGIKRNIVNIDGIKKAANEAKLEVEDLSKEMMMRPTALMKAWEAVGKAGVPYSLDGLSPEEKKRRLLKSQKTLVEMGGEVHRQDTDMPIDKASEFLHTLGINYKAGTDKFERGKGSGDYDTDIAKIANQLLYVANATKTSASKLSAGLRQYAPLYGNLGNSFGDSSALLGAAVQGGLDEIEAGTALKSMGIRFIKNFTSEGRDAWLASGLNRGDFTNETAVSGKKAAGTLGQLTDVKLKKKQQDALRDFFLKAEKEGRLNKPEFIPEAARYYNKLTGAKDQATRDRNLDRVRMATFSAGNDIDMFKLFRALSLKLGQMSDKDREKSLDAWGLGDLGKMAQEEVKKKLDKGTLNQGQLSVIGEGRHLSRYNAILALFGTAEELARRSAGLNNRDVTTAGRELAKDDSYWKWEHAMSRIEAAMAKLRDSDAITGFINTLAKLAEAVASASPGVQNLVGHLLVLTAVGAPIALAVSIVVGALAMLRGALALGLGLAGLGGAGAAAATGAGLAGAVAAGGAGAAAVAAAGAAVTPGAAAAGGAVAGGAALAGARRIGSLLVKGGRIVGRFVPGVGLVLGAYGAYQGYQAYQSSGSVWEGVKAFAGLGSAEAGQGGQPPSPAQTVTAAGRAVAGGTAPTTSVPSVGGASNDLSRIQAAAQAIPAAVRSAMDQVRAIVASVDLTADGIRVAESFAAGIRAGAPAVRRAANEALGAAARSAVRGSFSDGGR